MATKANPNVGIQYWLARNQWIGFVPIGRRGRKAIVGNDRASTEWCDTLDEAIQKYNELAQTLSNNPQLIERANNDQQWQYTTDK